MNATFVEEIVPVKRHEEIDGKHWLEIAITGWDEVKKHTKKILKFEGREYGWSCWNSDRMVSVFRSPPWGHAKWKA